MLTNRSSTSIPPTIPTPNPPSQSQLILTPHQRYHLYVSYACPWATRTLIARHLKGLTPLISVSAVHWHMGPLGWPFPSASDAASDPAMASPPAPGHEDFKHLREVYFSVNPEYTGRFTVPVLWDKVSKRIVSNESSEIVRMFNSAFDGLVAEEYRAVDLYPQGLRGEVEEANAWQYDLINNGVYKSGFATTQVWFVPCFGVEDEG